MFRPCLFLCIFILIGSEAGLAPFIKPCIWSDKSCILESSKKALPYFVKGLPELGVLPIDPLSIKEINADNADFKLNLKELKVSGLSKSVLINVERPDADKTARLEFEFPALVTGAYTAGGKIFVLDVEGNGDIEIKCGKIRAIIDIRLKTIEKGGKKYYKISGFDYTYDPIERVYYKLTNLYKGDEKKAKVILDLLNQNWKDILIGIGKPVIDKIVAEGVSRISTFFEKYPSGDLQILQ